MRDMLLYHPITGPHIKGSFGCTHTHTVVSIVVVADVVAADARVIRSIVCFSAIYPIQFGPLFVPSEMMHISPFDEHTSVNWSEPRVLGNVNVLRLPLTTIHLWPQMLTIMQLVHCTCSYQQVNTLQNLKANWITRCKDHSQLQITRIWASYTKAKQHVRTYSFSGFEAYVLLVRNVWQPACLMQFNEMHTKWFLSFRRQCRFNATSPNVCPQLKCLGYSIATSVLGSGGKWLLLVEHWPTNLTSWFCLFRLEIVMELQLVQGNFRSLPSAASFSGLLRQAQGKCAGKSLLPSGHHIPKWMCL